MWFGLLVWFFFVVFRFWQRFHEADALGNFERLVNVDVNVEKYKNNNILAVAVLFGCFTKFYLVFF